MNLAAIRTAIQAKGYATDTATQQTEAINSVYRELTGMRRWSWLEAQSTGKTTTVGQSYVTNLNLGGELPNFGVVDAIRLSINDDNYNLDYLPPQELRDLLHVDEATGVPEFWTYFNSRFTFYPIPDQVYTLTIDYIKDPDDLSADGDVPILPITHHDILVWGAIKEMAFRQRDWNAFNAANGEFTERLNRLQKSEGIRQRQRPGHVRRVRN